MNEVQQGPVETDAQRFKRIPKVLEAYAKDIDKHGGPLDSGLPGVLRFAASQIIETAAERNRLREQRDELLNFVRAVVNFYGMCEDDPQGTGGLGEDERNFLTVGRDLIIKVSG